MPKFIIKHGCCYVPPQDDSSDTTCQVFTNPDFDNRISEALCGVGKSSPEFANHRKQISWGYLDYDLVKGNCSKNHPETSREFNENVQHSTERYNTRKYENHIEKEQENVSLFTIYGSKQNGIYDSEKTMYDRQLSDASVYRPTTQKMENPQISSSEKILDCISMCLWKCSSWCQKID